MKQSSFLPQRKILGSYFFLFLLSSVGAQEVPNDSNEEIDVPISTLNITNSDQVGQNATLNTTETRPKCKQILKNFFDESVNEVSYPTTNMFSFIFLIEENYCVMTFRPVP